MTKSGWIWLVIIIIVLIGGGFWAMNSASNQSSNQPTTGVGTYPTDTTQPLEETPAPGALGTVPPQASGSPMTTAPAMPTDQGSSGANMY